MVKRWSHILLLSLLPWMLPGCFVDLGPVDVSGTGIVLTVQCEEPSLTKADDLSEREKDGQDTYNENLIKTVDFLFYPGTETGGDLNPDANAVYHTRRTLDDPALNQHRFDLVLPKVIINQIFKAENNNRATVYVLVNYTPASGSSEESWVNDNTLEGTSLNTLSQILIKTDFPTVEVDHAQPSFLMDAKVALTYNENNEPSVEQTVQVKRLASKLTVAIKVVTSATLEHEPDNSTNPPTQRNDEVWTPVLSTARVYLVDGTSTVLLSGAEAPQDQHEFITYKEDAHKNDRTRRFVKSTGEAYVGNSTIEGYTDYVETYPMYSYPTSWLTNIQKDVEHLGGAYREPYLKLEMDWTRQPENGYTYDRRKYYYKVFLPFDHFERNHWYSLFLDVGILGSETDEGKALLEPSCYLLDWQDKNNPVERPAVISKARYLFVEKKNWVLNNVETLSIPFRSSHDVVIVPGSITAKRPYYGEDKTLGYKEKLGAEVIKENGKYYLKYEADSWFDPITSSTISFHHTLNPDFKTDNFDYSPYTIEFDIVHQELLQYPTSATYRQYCKHITITQYPAIYIEAIRNSDDKIKKKGSVYGYDDGSAPWLDQPWGYVFVNGGSVGDRHFLRRYEYGNNNEPFFQLKYASSKREYQWQTVWYTGGSQDMFDIHVTVLPTGTDYVIGDPRVDAVDNLDDASRYPGLYEFTVEGSGEDRDNDIRILGYSYRKGFTTADALYDKPDGDEQRSLSWYYPTDKTSRTENMLAPSFRFASKFGGTEYGGSQFSDITQAYAEYRCAAYQEDGFPAGRWRLPTKAEIEFIAQLSAKKAFERLFSNATYWAAHGAITVNGDRGTTSYNSGATTALLRCVYDSWYWDNVDEVNNQFSNRLDRHDHFVWGDKKER